MKILGSFRRFAVLAGVLAGSHGFAQTVDENYYTRLGSCAKQVDSAGKRIVTDLYSYALIAGKLSYLAAKKVESLQSNKTPPPYCTETASDSTCGKAQITVNCIEGSSTTKDTAAMALRDISTLEAVMPYVEEDENGAYAIVAKKINGVTYPTTAQKNAFTTLETSLGRGTTATGNHTVSLADMKVLYDEITATDLKAKLQLESSLNSGEEGTYVGCLKQKIAANTCGTASNLGEPTNNTGNGTGGGDSGETVDQDPSGTDTLFNGSTATTSAAGTLSVTAWKAVQGLETSGKTASVRNFAQDATTYSSLSKRIRTTLQGVTGSKMPLPVTRGMGSSAPASTAPGAVVLNGTLTEDQITQAGSVTPATCFASSKLARDSAFYADKPAFRGSRTLHLYEAHHAGSEATHTDLNGADPGGMHAVLTSPYRMLVPSTKMEDSKNKEMKAAGSKTVYHPFVILRGFCPAGATKVNIGGSSAPRIVPTIAGVSTNTYQVSNDVACVADGRYKVFEAIVAFTGKPGLHFLELKADNIGAGGGSLTCKQEIFVAGEANKDTYSNYLKTSDYTNDATLIKIPRILATQTSDPDLGAAASQ